MRIHSGAGFVQRRKDALVRRENELTGWEGKLGGDAENKKLQAKVEIAKTDIANLKAKIGNSYV